MKVEIKKFTWEMCFLQHFLQKKGNRPLITLDKNIKYETCLLWISGTPLCIYQQAENFDAT